MLACVACVAWVIGSRLGMSLCYLDVWDNRGALALGIDADGHFVVLGRAPLVVTHEELLVSSLGRLALLVFTALSGVAAEAAVGVASLHRQVVRYEFFID